MPVLSLSSPSVAVSAASELLDRPALAGLGPERKIERTAELARELAALAPQRRQVGSEAARALGRGAGRDRVDAGERLVEDERERVQVGGRAGLATERLLGRHVRHRPDHVAGPGERVAAEHASDAEVGELRAVRVSFSGSARSTA